MANLDRRREPRIGHPATARLFRERTEARLQVVDVSTFGLGLRGPIRVRERELVSLSVNLENLGQFDLSGYVVFQQVPFQQGSESRSESRFGVELFGMSPEARTRWRNAIQELKNRYAFEHYIQPVDFIPTLPLHPEILIHPRSVSELKAIWARDLPRARMFVSCKLYLEPGTPMVVSIVHPQSHRRFMVEGEVRKSVESAGIRGVSLFLSGMNDAKLDAFYEYIEGSIHVEIDIPAERIDEADVEAMLRAES